MFKSFFKFMLLNSFSANGKDKKKDKNESISEETIMKMTVIVLASMTLLTLYIWIDFHLGLKKQKKQENNPFLPKRQTNVRLLTKGKIFYDELFADLERAKHHIHILFYIYRDDEISRQLSKLLIEKAKAGVEVRLLIDWFGAKLSKTHIKQLKKAGISFSYSHVPRFPYVFFSLNKRNHRKITTIDGKVGYIGGFNVGNEYLGRKKKFGFWRDFHLRIDGDGVQDLQAKFLSDWEKATSELLTGENYFPALQKGNVSLRFFVSDGVCIEDLYIDLIERAKQSIQIGTPYYVPGKAVQRTLLAAKKRGVHIELLIPKKSDYPLIKEAAYAYFNELLFADIHIYEYTSGFYHAKTFIIDRQFSIVGTANLDRRSFDLNSEINVLFEDRAFSEHVLSEYEKDIANAERLTLDTFNNRSLWHRVKEKASTFFSRFL